jgi:CheY-like chemotaxis protein
MSRSVPILLVEEDENDILLTRRSLAKMGVSTNVRAIRNGDDAIAYLGGTSRYSSRRKDRLPCLVLLELRIPGKDGFEVLEWVRSQPHLKGLPVVVLTSSHEIQDARRAYQIGADCFLVKPLESGDQTALMSLSGQQIWASVQATVTE